MSNSRRDFFKKVAGTAATLATVQALRDASGTTPAAFAAAAGPRPVAAGHLALEADGKLLGLVESVEGGHATADVVEEEVVGPSCGTVAKRLANVRYQDIAVACRGGMSAYFYEWVQAFCRCEPTRRSGAVLAADFNYVERSRRSFADALITEVTFPSLDAASKDAAQMTVKLSPEQTERQPASGKTLAPCGGSKAEKKWLASNFRLAIEGLDCGTVSRIEGLTIRQTPGSGHGGKLEREPGKLEIPNLKVTLAESAAESFFAWHEDFLIAGKSEGEKTGTLEYLTPNRSEVLFTLTFKQLGIFSLAAERAEANSDQIRRVTAEMYCEQIAFNFGPAAVGC